MDYSEYYTLIHPWQVYYDETWKRTYYFNILNSTSAWELPEEIQLKVESYYQAKFEQEEASKKLQEKNHMPKQQLLEDPKKTKNKLLVRKNYMDRPARKQVEQSLATQFAYKQGDEEYNIWYDKYLTDNKFKDREQALTRCDPELDSGYTKADNTERFSSYFCIHFSKGCCCEGANCKYFHRVPSIDECLLIDQSKDIFGRARFANHREDMTGVGSFLKETRTLYISDFKIVAGTPENQTEMYEILFRHFGIWGDIEDINLLNGKGVAFIRFAHRCMAEFAKEAMNSQSLDNNEIITIKWANDEPVPTVEKVQMENEKAVGNTMARKKGMEALKPKFNEANMEEESVGEEEGGVIVDKKEIEKGRVIMESCQKMDEILKRIERNNNNGELGEEEEEEIEITKKVSMMPEFNNQPLFFSGN